MEEGGWKSEKLNSGESFGHTECENEGRRKNASASLVSEGTRYHVLLKVLTSDDGEMLREWGVTTLHTRYAIERASGYTQYLSLSSPNPPIFSLGCYFHCMQYLPSEALVTASFLPQLTANLSEPKTNNLNLSSSLHSFSIQHHNPPSPHTRPQNPSFSPRLPVRRFTLEVKLQDLALLVVHFPRGELYPIWTNFGNQLLTSPLENRILEASRDSISLFELQSVLPTVRRLDVSSLRCGLLLWCWQRLCSPLRTRTRTRWEWCNRCGYANGWWEA